MTHEGPLYIWPLLLKCKHVKMRQFRWHKNYVHFVPAQCVTHLWCHGQLWSIIQLWIMRNLTKFLVIKNFSTLTSYIFFKKMMKIQGYVSLDLGQMRTSILKIKKFLSWTTTNQNSKNRGGKPIMHQHMLKNKIKFFYKKFSSNLFVSRICAYLGHDHESSYLDFTVSRRARELQRIFAWIFFQNLFLPKLLELLWYPKIPIRYR